MEEKNYVELRSEDVQEILGTPPHWLVRWGTMIVLAGFGMMVLAAWFIQYPDVVSGKVLITTIDPPADVVARADGTVQRMLVRDNMPVNRGDLLAVLQSTANYEHVIELDMAVRAWQRSRPDSLRLLNPPRNLSLGDLQIMYADFIQQLDYFQFGKENKNTAVQSNIGSINKQIRQLEQSISFEEKGLDRVREQLKTAEELYETQKKLYEQGITSRVDFEKERTKLADLERQRDLYEENILRKRSEIIGLRKGIADASFDQEENTSNTSSRLLGSLNTLRSGIDKWKQTYLITSPITGKAVVNNSMVNRFVREGEQILTIVPSKSDLIVGKMLLPVEVSGRVKPAQKVILKLDNYPYHEFGTLRGVVFSKSLVPKDNQYAVLISIKDSDNNVLKTNYNKTISFEAQLYGKAEIITENKGLIARITDQILGGRQN
ncbi:MAG: HlyD family efflux transporter periplasmic adaptor subunit [Lewinellaceae bacterium]|jgi:multidrug resistance efflux pump|nr:HlyD family efflux transporter periplasmic adaptor subunit [Lewinellaceae bacterium]